MPTTLELGYANSDYIFWVGMFAPANTPDGILNKLHDETLSAMRAPALQDKLAKLEVEPLTMTRAELGAYVQSEIAANAVLAKAAGIAAQ